MNQQNILEFLKEKINSKEYSRTFANVLYKYYIAKKGENENLENAKLLGIGKVITTNYCLVNKDYPLCWNYKNPNTYHFLILKNMKTNDPFGLLLPPINYKDSIECKSFQYAFPIFDVVSNAKVNEEGLFFSNVFNEQVEVETSLFDKSVYFLDLLIEKHKKLNAKLFEFSQKDSTPLLSTVVFEYLK